MTTTVLIAYYSAEGQTAQIADRLARRLEEHGVSATAAIVDGAPPPDGFDAVILGDSIHGGRHSRELIEYATRHHQQLNVGTCAAFQVSLTSAHDDDESVQKASTMMDDFCRATGLEPDRIGLFAGALAFSRYRGVRRFLMRHVARGEGLDADPSQDHSYTDWAAVDSFADSVLRMVRRSAMVRSDGVSELIDYGTASVLPETPLRAVVEAMSASSATAVLVRSPDVDPLCTAVRSDVVGIVTEHDIVDAVHEGADMDLVWAADVMSPAPVALDASASLDAMAAAMSEEHIRHVVVLAGEGRVGLVSSGALIAAMAAD